MELTLKDVIELKNICVKAQAFDWAVKWRDLERKHTPAPPVQKVEPQASDKLMKGLKWKRQGKGKWVTTMNIELELNSDTNPNFRKRRKNS